MIFIKKLNELVDFILMKKSFEPVCNLTGNIKFLSIISHDLKSPFHALLGISDVLLEEWDNLSEENRIELVSDLQKTSKDTFKLLENLLDWSKAQREKLEISINEIKISEFPESKLETIGKNFIPETITPSIIEETQTNIINES